MASVAQYLTTLAGASGANAEALRAAAQMQIEVRSPFTTVLRQDGQRRRPHRIRSVPTTTRRNTRTFLDRTTLTRRDRADAGFKKVFFAVLFLQMMSRLVHTKP